jgi:hypothetical protein
MTTYLQAVNDVLVRLREEEVSTVSETTYSALIGKFVNDAKRQIYYTFDGVDSNYDTKVTLFPIPDGVYSIPFSLIVPQAVLSSDSTVIAVPAELIVQNAYARALVERGEDGGLNSSEAYQLYKSMLSDYIATEATRYPEFGTFEAV